MKDKKEFINILETVYRGARKGCDLVIAPKDYSSKYHYKLIGTVVLNHNLKDVKPVALSLEMHTFNNVYIRLLCKTGFEPYLERPLVILVILVYLLPGTATTARPLRFYRICDYGGFIRCTGSMIIMDFIRCTASVTITLAGDIQFTGSVFPARLVIPAISSVPDSVVLPMYRNLHMYHRSVMICSVFGVPESVAL
ncbi:hypothetical protein CTI12_AA513420 [Artemisia annua]|uniref:Uncharacterized protein n=1 Tax=Artemisia annua TaxID=35608 RepID=A0A2U1LAE0_ARTAN|nr:hypothetical protein CTI12_AA513420 [Artemisia annua]